MRWFSTPNQSGNYSDVSVQFWIYRPNANWSGSHNLNGETSTININGNSASQKITFSLVNAENAIWGRTVRVQHDSSGSKKIGISASGSTGLNNIGTYAFSATITLDKIARQSSWNWVTSTWPHEFGKATAFTCTAANQSYLHSIEVRINGSLKGTVLRNSKGSGTKSFTVPLEWAQYCTNATSVSASARCITHIKEGDYGSGSLMGFTDFPMTIRVPDSMVPNISSITPSESNSKVKSLSLPSNNYIQSVSQVKLAASASGTHGSTITWYEFQLGSASKGSSATSQQFDSNQLTGSGSITAKVSIKDSRGRTASKSMTITSLAYSPPKITTFTADRNGTTATTVNMTKAGSYSNLGGKNPATWLLEFKLAVASAYGATGISVTDSTNSYSKTGIKADASYQFKLTLTDKLGNFDNKVADIKSQGALFDLHKDLGVGIGKLHEEGHGVMDVAGDAWIDGELRLKGKKLLDIFYPVGSIYESVKSDNPSTFMGGTWVRFGNGRVTIGLDESEAYYNTPEKEGGNRQIEDRAIQVSASRYNGIGGQTNYNGRILVTPDSFVNNDTSAVNYPLSIVQPYIIVYRWKRTA